MNVKTIFWMIGVWIGLLINPAHGATNNRIQIFVSILPQAFLVERIGGDHVSVNVLVVPGKSPATYAPVPSQLAQLAKARFYFRIGVPFETALLPKLKHMTGNMDIIDLSNGISLRKMVSGHHHHDPHEHTDSAHGQAEETDGNDPHIWLNPLFMKQMARTVLETLASNDTPNKATYERNYKTLAHELDEMHAALTAELMPFKGRSVFVFHPSFGYFTDLYGLKQEAIELEGKSPKGKELSRLIKKARQEKARVIFVQPQFEQSAAQAIAEAIDGAVLPIDPLAKDYIQNVKKMAHAIRSALSDN